MPPSSLRAFRTTDASPVFLNLFNMSITPAGQLYHKELKDFKPPTDRLNFRIVVQFPVIERIQRYCWNHLHRDLATCHRDHLVSPQLTPKSTSVGSKRR
eukprot:1027741-Amphidinium_carterae.1